MQGSTSEESVVLDKRRLRGVMGNLIWIGKGILLRGGSSPGPLALLAHARTFFKWARTPPLD